jgi:cytochrome P450
MSSNPRLSAAFVPGPSPDVVARHLSAQDLAGVPDFLCDVAERYGPVVSLELAHRPYYLVSDPEVIRDVLVTKARSFRKGRDAVYEFVGEGLFTSEPPIHTAQRRLLQPAFHHERIADFGRVMLEQTQAVVSEWAEHDEIDVAPAMRRLTLRIGAEALFSYVIDDRLDAIGEAVTEVISRAAVGIFSGLRQRPSLLQMRNFRAARSRLHALADDLILQRRSARSTEHRNIYDILAGARDENGCGPTDGHLRNEVLTLLLAAQESTAIALTWTLYLLAAHQNVQRRLCAELDSIIHEGTCTADDFRRLPYATAVFKEALRLFPPAWILGRRTVEPVHLHGIKLPRGAAVYISPYVVHRNPRRYDNPATFRPERWLESNQPTRFTYMPFGGGIRGCIGESFAWLEGITVLAVIASRFTMTVADDKPVQVSPLLTLRPAHPVRLRVARRRSR